MQTLSKTLLGQRWTNVLSTYLLTWVTWVNYPSCPKGRDLNFSLKESSEGARTTASGRLFQALTTRCEKKLDLMSVRAYGFTSFWLFPRRVCCDWVKYRFLLVVYMSFKYLYTLHINQLLVFVGLVVQVQYQGCCIVWNTYAGLSLYL